ncbi:MAG: TA system VapC family ribonuclease toxin [Gemmatimonadota bacterium]
MTHLLDVNALIALGFMAHVHHDRVAAWVATLGEDDVLATCSITELGFVRIAPQARLAPDVATARHLLEQIRGVTRPPFVRLTDEVGVDALSAWADTPAATTDGHLSALASHRSARLVTLDEGIPGSFLVPR